MQRLFFLITQGSPFCLGILLFYSDRSLAFNSQFLVEELMYLFLFLGLSALNYSLPLLLKTNNQTSKTKSTIWPKARLMSVILFALIIFMGSLVSLSQHSQREIFATLIFSIAIYSAARSSEARALFGQAAILWLIANSTVSAVSIGLITNSLEWRSVIAGIGLSAIVTAVRLSSWFWSWEHETNCSQPSQTIRNRLLRFYSVLWTLSPSCFAALVYLKQMPQITLVLLGVLPLASPLIAEARVAEKKFAISKNFLFHSTRLCLAYLAAIIAIRSNLGHP